MARPQKKGLEYFPLDVDIDSDEKVDYVLARHGFEAFGILVKILMEIYRQGYYMMWTERQQYLLSKRVNVDVMYAKTVVSAYINEGFFSRNLYEKYEILTSHGIQTRYLQAVGRRSVVQIAEEFSLLDPSELPKNAKIVKIGVSVCENYSYCQHNVDNNGVSNSNMSAETPQSKVKNNNVVVVTRARARDIRRREYVRSVYRLLEQHPPAYGGDRSRYARRSSRPLRERVGARSNKRGSEEPRYQREVHRSHLTCLGAERVQGAEERKGQPKWKIHSRQFWSGSRRTGRIAEAQRRHGLRRRPHSPSVGRTT